MSSAPEPGFTRGPLAGLIRFCLEQKLVVSLVALGFIAWGVLVAPFDWELEGLARNPVPVDAIPDIGENQQIVFTEWPGRSPQDIDDQISYPLTVALLGLPEVKDIRSYSVFGFSTIYVVFEDGVEFYWSRSRVLEKLNSLPSGTLPSSVTPVLGPDATALGQVFWYTLEGRDTDGNPTGGWDLDELRSIQDFTVKYRLASVSGVAEVASIGGFVREYQVDVDPDAMRASGVTLAQVIAAVRRSNLDVGARTIEVNRAEYIVRGLGFIEDVSDLEQTAITARDGQPILVGDIASVALGPALRRGVLTKAGVEAVGGVVVVRYGENPMATIQRVRDQIENIASGLPSKVLADGTESRVAIVPFYDRTGLIKETLGTLNSAIEQQVLVTIIVVVLMVMHLRSSLLISSMLPIAVLMTFIGMKLFRVDANIVALSGIAIAVGTIVDMGIVLSENILRRLEEATPDERPIDVIHRASCEVGGAVLTAVLTTIVSFLPVFTMEAAEGKLFKPLAYTKTFALIASIIIALTIIPPMAHFLFSLRVHSSWIRRSGAVLLIAGGVPLGILASAWAGTIVVAFGLFYVVEPLLPRLLARTLRWSVNVVAVVMVLRVLAAAWEPIGPDPGLVGNVRFIGSVVGGLLLVFWLFRLAYPAMLAWALRHKAIALLPAVLVVVFGLACWLGPVSVLGSLNKVRGIGATDDAAYVQALSDAGLVEQQAGELLWTSAALNSTPSEMSRMLRGLEVPGERRVLRGWRFAEEMRALERTPWKNIETQDNADAFNSRRISAGKQPINDIRLKWTLAHSWDGIGSEFMPSLAEGAFLYMPTTMPHASIGEATDILKELDRRIMSVPEVELAVGKIGRVDSPLDPAPVSMVETVVQYSSEYISDESGRRLTFAVDPETGAFSRDEWGELVEDPEGKPYRQWRDEIETPQDIWDEIVVAAEMPGVTSAPKLQPIETRIIMLQSGFRSPMGIKVFGPDLETIEAFGLELERLLKEVPSVQPATVFADRVVGKPYLEIDIDRERIARYGIQIGDVQEVIEVAIGGKPLTMTVEGRERYPVRVRYLRELRDQPETLGDILVPAPGGTQVPLRELATIMYRRGPQMIKSEDTFLVAYVLFDKKPGYAEVGVVEDARAFIERQIAAGALTVPAGVSFDFAGSYENQVRATKRLSIVLPLALGIIFLLLHFQFKRVGTTFMVFSGVFVAWSGGFLMLWLYAQPWFLDFDFMGANLRELFQVRPFNLSVAVWVGFLALFGIATDDGVVMATRIEQTFAEEKPDSIEAIRRATCTGATLRIRAALMTSATTILALLPVLTSTGRGSDIMIPMAIPTFGGMSVALVTLFVVPVLYCWTQEWKHRIASRTASSDQGALS